MFKLKNFRSSGGDYYADLDKGNGENIPVEIQKGCGAGSYVAINSTVNPPEM